MLLTCASFSQTYVRGYVKSNGTYVEPHYRSSPNNTKSDNWSTYGNVNPYTGEIGTKTYLDYNNSSYYNSLSTDSYFSKTDSRDVNYSGSTYKSYDYSYPSTSSLSKSSRNIKYREYIWLLKAINNNLLLNRINFTSQISYTF